MSRVLPILFNTDMVRSILDERKTVTRRLIKPQPKSKLAYCFAGYGHGTWGYPPMGAWKYWNDESFQLPDKMTEEELSKRWKPPCQADDILYVRETWAYHENAVGGIIYRARCPQLLAEQKKWHPSIHMPKEAARIWLKVTDVRVERLQDIMKDSPGPNNQVAREGCKYGFDFIAVWEGTIKKTEKDMYGWDANPWVWVIEFERCEKPD